MLLKHQIEQKPLYHFKTIQSQTKIIFKKGNYNYKSNNFELVQVDNAKKHQLSFLVSRPVYWQLMSHSLRQSSASFAWELTLFSANAHSEKYLPDKDSKSSAKAQYKVVCAPSSGV